MALWQFLNFPPKRKTADCPDSHALLISGNVSHGVSSIKVEAKTSPFDIGVGGTRARARSSPLDPPGARVRRQ